ncbi:hypothetical protein [Tenacibaculum holothuriorum]|uniref:hypothetical protein n=1 Tax=Tenacibaculum holothuriorum TaxID=1635173 RepID=UPI00117F5F42|nr:hypothetical protein [Tenacibaculum holothuriorum]
MFIIKYGVRQHYVSVSSLCFGYVLFNVGAIFLIDKKKSFLNNYKGFHNWFLIVSLLFIGLSILMNLKIDGNSLSVDRWSALETLVKSTLNGEYPYLQKDHLGKTSSNFPALFFIGLPFYLIGKIGFIQPFIMLVVLALLFLSRVSNSSKLLVLFLFITSPSYLWEVYAKSDLMSNIILMCLFIFYWNTKTKGDLFNKIVLLAFSCAFFLLTRGVLVIPLLVFLCKDFFQLLLNKKLRFIVCFFFFLIMISLPVLLTISTLDQVKTSNPFMNQTESAPAIIQLLMILFSIVLSFRVKKLLDVFLFVSLILSGFIGFSIFLNILSEGFGRAILNSLSDISYLNMSIPFIISALLIYNEKELFKEGSLISKI